MWTLGRHNYSRKKLHENLSVQIILKNSQENSDFTEPLLILKMEFKCIFTPSPSLPLSVTAPQLVPRGSFKVTLVLEWKIKKVTWNLCDGSKPLNHWYRIIMDQRRSLLVNTLTDTFRILELEYPTYL